MPSPNAMPIMIRIGIGFPLGRDARNTSPVKKETAALKSVPRFYSAMGNGSGRYSRLYPCHCQHSYYTCVLGKRVMARPPDRPSFPRL